MGAHTEVNTLVRFPETFDFTTLVSGLVVPLEMERVRIMPLEIALLYFHGDWNFLGYCRVLNLTQSKGRTSLNAEILTVFNESDRKLYKRNFIEAGKFTGEAK